MDLHGCSSDKTPECGDTIINRTSGSVPSIAQNGGDAQGFFQEGTENPGENISGADDLSGG